LGEWEEEGTRERETVVGDDNEGEDEDNKACAIKRDHKSPVVQSDVDVLSCPSTSSSRVS